MNAAALKAVLATTGLEVVYGKWSDPPALPYLVYRFTDSADLIADGVNYHPMSDWQVELYSEIKDEASEAAVQTALVTAGVPYEKHETYVESEKLYQVVYLIRT